MAVSARGRFERFDNLKTENSRQTKCPRDDRTNGIMGHFAQ